SGTLRTAVQPSIYTERSTVTLPAGAFQQLSDFWCLGHPRLPDEPLMPLWQGIRMTLDSRGYPVIWEVIDSRERIAAIFVSKSLDAKSAAAYGAPLPGRHFAIERSVNEQPDVVVARLLDDGPEPMGPFVYLSREGLEITTLSCRCMPSQ